MDDPYLSLETTPGHDLFVGTYRARQFPIFAPTTIAGPPAVAETSRAEDTACVVTVAINNGEGLSAWWYAREPHTPATAPCTNAKRALAAVIAHLPPR